MAPSFSSTDSASGSASSWSYAFSMSVMIRAVFGIGPATVAALVGADLGLARVAVVGPVEGGAAEAQVREALLARRVVESACAARVVAKHARPRPETRRVLPRLGGDPADRGVARDHEGRDPELVWPRHAVRRANGESPAMVARAQVHQVDPVSAAAVVLTLEGQY